VDRLGQLVRAEWNARTDHEDDEPVRPVVEAHFQGAVVTRAGKAVDLDTAYRALELAPGADLDQVREAYRRLARHYHPRTTSGSPDQQEAAHRLQENLVQALETLERHLLPAPGPRSRSAFDGR